MANQSQKISLQIVNNTNTTQSVSVMANPYTLNANLNDVTEYRYDITSFTPTTENSFTIQYANKANPNVILNANSSFTNGINGLVNSLNNLNLGFFYLNTVGANTYITTNNDNVVFYNFSVYFGSLLMLFDFYQSANYIGVNTSIPDISGNNYTAYPINGTGLGTQVNLSSTTISYQTSAFGYMNFNSSSATNPYSIKLNDAAKFIGLSPYTIVVWFTNTNTTFSTDTFQGLISSEGRDILNNRTGYNLYVSNSGGFNIGHTRFNLQTNAQALRTVNFSSFTANTWYCAFAGFDGSNMYTGLFDGTITLDTFANNYSLYNNTNYNASMGLRYNNFLNGNIGYAAIYSGWSGIPYITDLINSTKSRYGY